MALTFAQFQELKNKGLSPQQIANFEKGNAPEQKPGFFKTLASDITKSVAGTAYRASIAISNPFGGIPLVGETLRKAVQPEALRVQEAQMLQATGIKPKSTLQQAFKDPFGVFKQEVGAGLEDVSNIYTAPAVGKLIKPTLSGLIKRGLALGAKEGAIIGATGEAGRALTNDQTLAQGLGSTALGAVGGTLLGGTLGTVAPLASVGYGKIRQAVKPTAEYLSGALEKTIEKGISKGVRPSVAKTRNVAQRENYFKDAGIAVETIIKNKENLKFIDDGLEIARLPQSLKEFESAIGDTKKDIFKEYNAQAQKAGEKGLEIALEPAAKILDAVSNSPVLKDIRPEVVKYAESRAKAMRERGVYGAEQTQEAIKILNESLDAFYRQPDYSTASKAMIDLSLVRNLREELAKGIQRTTGKQYQNLKNRYKALLTIEKEVAHRATVDARQNIKGLVESLSDITSGAQLVQGLVSLEPSIFASGATIKGLSKWIKHVNNPNRLIKQMFSNAEKLITKKGELGKIGKKSNIGLIGKAKQAGKETLQEIQDINTSLKNKAGLTMQDINELTPIIRGTKGLTADDIMQKHPDINLKRDVPVTDIYGKKSVIDAGEALTPYELKGNKVLLQDGETYIVSKNQYQNIKGRGKMYNL